MPAVPVGAAGEKFLKFDAFLCIFKAFFRFPSGRRERSPILPPGYATARPFGRLRLTNA